MKTNSSVWRTAPGSRSSPRAENAEAGRLRQSVGDGRRTSREEIFTDKYGRVKVQFQWDRDGRNDADSSCWMRVIQPWAGGSHGVICIPRIGNEVIVEFMEGDPDQPIISGSVYNPLNMPPYTLPANAHTMGFKSNTTKGGSGYNEMAIVDDKSNELVRIHAQKDMDTTVLNNDTQYVKVDRKIAVDGTPHGSCETGYVHDRHGRKSDKYGCCRFTYEYGSDAECDGGWIRRCRRLFGAGCDNN